MPKTKPDSTDLSRREQGLIAAGTEIAEGPPEDRDYVHANFAHIALPRSKPRGNEFQRRFGAASIHIQAGALYESKLDKHVMQPIPYGVRPRQFLIYATTFAIKHKTCEVDLGHSMRELMTNMLGYKHVTGGERGSRTTLKNQLRALVACHMTLGWHERGRDITQKYDLFAGLSDPIQWYSDRQASLFPATVKLSAEYLESVRRHAFPVDPRAIAALDSALGIDIYCWMAHRLRRIKGSEKLAWKSLKEQFGHDYEVSKDFKKAFAKALRTALTVYPAARVDSEDGGLRFYESPPPVPEDGRIVLPVARSA